MSSASWVDSPKQMADACDIIITCLPSPAFSATVMAADEGILAGLSAGKIWSEMSTTDATEVTRLGALVNHVALIRWIVRCRADAIGRHPEILTFLLDVTDWFLTKCCRF